MKKIIFDKQIAMMVVMLLALGNLVGCSGTESKSEESADVDYAADFNPDEVVYSEEHEMTTVIDGCDTFTQILDKEENKGMGYINAHIGDDDVLLMASETYEYDTDLYAAIDAEIFCYKDNIPTYMGYVAAGGTAYPLSVKDGVLFVGGNHFMTKYSIRDDELLIIEEAYVMYDTDGNPTYYYRAEGEDFSDYSSAEAEQKFNSLFDEIDEESILYFETVGGVE